MNRLQSLNNNYMLNNSFINLTATEWIKKIKAKEFSVEEYANFSKFFIKKNNEKLKAFVSFDEEKIDQQIRRITSKTKYINSPLLGVPIGIKDIFNTYDYKTGFGSKIYENYNSGNDARVVSNLRRSGSVVIGKTLTSEFAVHYTKGISHPLDKKRTPGSSSAGSAVAVSSGLVPISLSSQTAGSTIRPSSYCGIYGFKPSFGLIPRTGVLKTTDTLDTIGWMARSVEDILLVFKNLHVKGLNYPIVNKKLKKKNVTSLKKFRFVFLESSFDQYLEKNLKHHLNLYLKRLTKKGLNFVHVKLDDSFNQIINDHNTIYCKSLSYYFRNEFKFRKSYFSSVLANMIEKGRKIKLENFQLALKNQELFSNLFDKKFKQFDFIICPSTTNIAPLISDIDSPDSNLIWTYLGLPVITLPKLKGFNNLPVGISIIGRKYNDYELLEVCKLIDRI